MGSPPPPTNNLPGTTQVRLVVPRWYPETQDEHSENLRAIERWANGVMFSSFLPVVYYGPDGQSVITIGTQVPVVNFNVNTDGNLMMRGGASSYATFIFNDGNGNIVFAVNYDSSVSGVQAPDLTANYMKFTLGHIEFHNSNGNPDIIVGGDGAGNAIIGPGTNYNVGGSQTTVLGLSTQDDGGPHVTPGPPTARIWVDQLNNKLMFHVTYTDGVTVKNGSVALV